MAERIDLPAMPKGEPEEQLEELYRYLYRMAEALNANLAEIGGADLTDEERQLMLSLTQADGTTRSGGGAAYDWESAETLKSLIIKTATWVKNTLDSWRISLLGEYVAQGKFGKYVRNTSMDVDVTPTGTTQSFKFHEIIEDLKKYEVNAKNYIKTGLLRTEGELPVYGVAVGKDVVTFAEDGTETYNDGNKVGEFTADGISFFRKNNGSLVKLAELLGTALKFYYAGSLRTQMDTDGVKFYKGSTLLAEMLGTALKFYYSGSLRTQMDSDGIKFYIGNTMLSQMKAGELDFYQNGSLSMKLTSSRIGFYNSGKEYMYIQGGKIYTAGDMEIGSGKNIAIGNWKVNSKGLTYYDGSTPKMRFGKVPTSVDDMYSGVYADSSELQFIYLDEWNIYRVRFAKDSSANSVAFMPVSNRGASLGTYNYYWENLYCKYIQADSVSQTSSREVKHDIKDLPEMGEEIDQLRPVSFIYNDDETGKTQYGLIHEETVGILPDICAGAEGDDPKAKGINYISLVPVLLKEIQDLRKRTAMLEKRVEELEGRE